MWVKFMKPEPKIEAFQKYITLFKEKTFKLELEKYWQVNFRSMFNHILKDSEKMLRKKFS